MGLDMLEFRLVLRHELHVQNTMSANPGPERRKGEDDRRTNGPDRRNDDRVIEEVLPRRNPEQADRRKKEG